MAFRIHILIDGKPAGTHELRKGDKLVLGRESTNDIVVLDRSVSRRHCTLEHVDNGIDVTDLDSANGIYYEGEPKKRIVLRDGDQVSLGMARIRVSNSSTHTGMIPIEGLSDALSSDSSGSFTGGGSDEDSAFDSSSGFLTGPNVPYLFRDLDRRPPTGSVSESSISERSEYREFEKERLLLLVELGKSLGQSLDVEVLLNRILDHLFQILPVRRAVIALTDDGTNFSARVTRPAGDSENMSEVASQGVLKQVVASREGRIIEDASLDQMLRSNMSVVVSNIRAAVCAPIIVNDRCLGAIYADFPGRPRLYTQNDLDFLTAFASIAGVSLENARMTEQIRKNDRVKRDLEIAAEIQQGILPNEAFEIPGLEIDWAYKPTLNVGGDFYDVIELAPGRVALIIGDVSGKSVPAALFMSRTISILRATVSDERTPGEVLTRTNQLLGSIATERVIFATAMVCVIDLTTRTLCWSSAGHNPGLLRDPDNGDVRQLGSHDVPLGVIEDVDYATNEVGIVPGSYLTLYTDGLVECRNSAGEELGIERVNGIVSENLGEGVGVATKAMIRAIEDHHRGSTYLQDDVAILNVRVL
ncbi:MAG: SpoIIE family protein phosphatase [Planctomycetota bacterium]